MPRLWRCLECGELFERPEDYIGGTCPCCKGQEPRKCKLGVKIAKDLKKARDQSRSQRKDSPIRPIGVRGYRIG